MSRPHFARRVRGRRALTLAFAPRLIIQLSGGCQILTSTNRAPRRVEPVLMATVRLHIETVQKTAVGGGLTLEKDVFKQAFLTSMRIITYSDLHLEFGSGWMLPPAVNGDVMILAGDIVTLRDYEPLDQILRKWKTPAL